MKAIIHYCTGKTEEYPFAEIKGWETQGWKGERVLTLIKEDGRFTHIYKDDAITKIEIIL